MAGESSSTHGAVEIVDQPHAPTKRAAHEVIELDDYSGKTDVGAQESGVEAVDEMGSVPVDRKDMHRMGKQQEMRVIAPIDGPNYAGTHEQLLTLRRECSVKSRC